MILSRQEFIAFDDRCGNHKAETISFSKSGQRDFYAETVAKDKSVVFLRKVDKKILTWVEYWVTVHYGKHKDADHKGRISSKFR